MPYNWGFSLRIAMQFRDCYPRASDYVNCIYDVNLGFSAKLFQHHQKRWELYKKTVITLDRLLKRAEYTKSISDFKLLKQKLDWIMKRNPGNNVIKLPKKSI